MLPIGASLHNEHPCDRLVRNLAVLISYVAWMCLGHHPGGVPCLGNHGVASFARDVENPTPTLEICLAIYDENCYILVSTPFNHS